MIYQNHLKVQKVEVVGSGKDKQKQQQQHQQQQQYALSLPEKKRLNTMMILVIITTMIAIQVIPEATDPTGAKVVVGGLTEEIT